MYKKYALLLAALLFALAAHLRPCYDYRLDGVPIASGLTPRAAALAEAAARDAAEEILRRQAALPVFEKRLRFRLRRSADDARALSDALLQAAEGIALRYEVRVGGVRLGWVADGGALRTALDSYITNTLPTWASGGRLSRELQIRRLYTRDGYLTAQGDMLLLITGAAPVFYYDETGRLARA